MTATSTLVLVSTVIALSIVACGGSPEPAKAPTAAPGESASVREPRTIDEALDEIAAQQARLDDSLKSESSGASGPSGTTPRPAERPPSQADKSSVREEKSVDVCGVRCRAFTSMKNAVDALCRMTGDREARCVNARQTLDVSASRVASCGCH